MATKRKIDTVKALTDKLVRAKALVLADYVGLTHKQLEELRRELKKVEAEFTITKNTLLKRALESVKKAIPDEHLAHSTAALLAYADEVAPVKTLVKFFKTANLGKIKVGLLGAHQLTDADVEKLATLPTREVLLAQLVGQLNAPISAFHNALSWNIRKLAWTLEAIRTKKH